jgi:hypothetical protein
MEDVVGWVLRKGDDGLVQKVQADVTGAPSTVAEIVPWLKKPTNDGGAKTDLVVHEAIVSAILSCSQSRAAIRSILDALVQVVTSQQQPSMAAKDEARSKATCAVWRLCLES